jgi:hypothetical protein
MTEAEVKALRLLIREEVQAEVRPLRDEMNMRFDRVATQIEGLYQRDEKREQEYLFIREQIRRIETRLDRF